MWGTPLRIKRTCLAKGRSDDFGPKSASEILVCVPGFFRATLSAVNSQTKLRVGGTAKSQKNMFGKGEERRFRADIRLGNSGACVRVPGFFRGMLSALNSPTKLRVGDTTKSQKKMFGKSEERRFRAEIRLGNSGACVCVPGFFRGMLSGLNSQTKLRVGEHH